MFPYQGFALNVLVDIFKHEGPIAPNKFIFVGYNTADSTNDPTGVQRVNGQIYNLLIRHDFFSLQKREDANDPPWRSRLHASRAESAYFGQQQWLRTARVSFT